MVHSAASVVVAAGPDEWAVGAGADVAAGGPWVRNDVVAVEHVAKTRRDAGAQKDHGSAKAVRDSVGVGLEPARTDHAR